MADEPRKQLMEGLKEDLRGEFQAVIMYRLYASMVQGPYRQELRTFFTNEIPEELGHAQILADKIAAFGGTPDPMPAPVMVVSDPKAMLEAARKPRRSTASLPSSTRSSRTSRIIATNCS
jgi:bacterioferritin